MFQNLITAKPKPENQVQEKKPMIALLETLMSVQITVKKYHLLQPDRTDATHNALAILYDKLDELNDEFVETHFGVNEVEVLDFNTETVDDIQDYILEKYNYLTSAREIVPTAWQQSLLDVILSEFAHALYRLRLVTSAAKQ